MNLLPGALRAFPLHVSTGLGRVSAALLAPAEPPGTESTGPPGGIAGVGDAGLDLTKHQEICFAGELK